MKITHLDGSITDTDKLNDLSAEVLEALNKLTGLFCKYKIPFLLTYYDPILKGFSGSQNFNNSLSDYIRVINSMNKIFIDHGGFLEIKMIKPLPGIEFKFAT